MQPNPTHTKLTLKVINLWGEPGAGKSTVAAGLFNLMKLMGEKVELVTEYAKDLTYEKNHVSLQNQLLILATQDNRLRRQSEPAAAALQVEMREIMLDATRDQDDVLHVISDSEAPYVIYRSLRLPGNESTLAFDNGRFDL